MNILSILGFLKPPLFLDQLFSSYTLMIFQIIIFIWFLSKLMSLYAKCDQDFDLQHLLWLASELEIEIWVLSGKWPLNFNPKYKLFWGIIRNLQLGPFYHTLENITVKTVQKTLELASLGSHPWRYLLKSVVKLWKFVYFKCKKQLWNPIFLKGSLYKWNV